jgi:hypothetical protein
LRFRIFVDTDFLGIDNCRTMVCQI